MIKKRRAIQGRRSLCVERLEDRTVLAVSVVFNNGLLTITGDNQSNFVDITETQGMINVFTSSGAAGPFTGVQAISVQLFDADFDSVDVEGITIPSFLRITEGTGNNDFARVAGSTVGQLDVTVGREENGAQGSVTAEFQNDVITGDHVNINLLNESGVSGRRANGSPGSGQGSQVALLVNANTDSITLNSPQENRPSLQFTGNGMLNARVDDGVAMNGSTVQMFNISTAGNLNGTLGDHFQDVQMGDPNLGIIRAANLNQAIGNDVDTVMVDANVNKRENFSVGDVTTNPTPPSAPSVKLLGMVGGAFGDGLFANFGSNRNTSLTNGWPIEVTEGITGVPFVFPATGLVLKAGDGDALKVDPTTVVGDVDITMGSGGVNGVESLSMLQCTGTDPKIRLNSNVGDMVTITFMDLVVTGSATVLDVKDSGHGKDTVMMSNVQLAGFINMALSDSGRNVVFAHNVTARGGFINGGAGNGDTYVNQGGNSGYAVIGFEILIGPPPP